MTRSISAANQTASSASTVLPVLFVKLQFDSGTVCLHSQLGPLSFGGDTYTGAGGIGGIGAVDEDSELSRSTLQLTLRGLPTDLIAVVAQEYYQGRPATIFLGYLDPTTRHLVDTPFVLYKGRMDSASTNQGDALTVSVSVESQFVAWDRPKARRYNNADQQQRFPGDRGLEYVEQSTEKQIVWGQAYAG